MSYLVVDDVSFAYQKGHPVVSGVSFTVNKGETFALLGPSGSGKTSMLRILAGFERPQSGKIILGDSVLSSSKRHLPPEQRTTGMVFQDYALFPHLTVGENLAFGIRNLGADERNRRVLELMASLELGPYAGRKPQELSGGQQQRVALGRALAPRPRLLLLDEAFSGLDPSLRSTVRARTRELLTDHGVTSILVTHDQEEALSFADRISVLHLGELLQTGTPQQLYESPQTGFVAEFLGGANMLAGDAEDSIAQCVLGKIELVDPHRGKVTLAVRPEQIRFSDEGAAGKIAARHYHGHDLTWDVVVEGITVIVRTSADVSHAPGDAVRLTVTSPAAVVGGGS